MDIEAHYREHGPALLAYLCARLPHAVAEDIHHDIWIKAATFNDPRALTGDDLRRWLFRVAKNALLDHVKKASTRRETYALTEADANYAGRPVLEAIETEDLLAALRVCIKELPEVFRNVVQGKLSGELPDEIAKRLGISRATVDTRFYRAKEMLAECTGANQV